MNPFESTTFGNSLSLRVDGAIGAMSLSPNGRDAVLAGRKGLFVIDLDDPFLAPRWLHHITSWEVADVQWSPHQTVKPSWCVSTSNQKALLWDLSRPSNNAIQNVLHRHVRAITDINFHPKDPELLATCSIDTFVYCWDMRTPRRPVAKWAEWRAGATQVKWNKNDPYQIASSHHHSFYIWDSRKGALPLLTIENAHHGKINGLDFSSSENRLITCSNDKSVKIWNLDRDWSQELKPAVVVEAEFPIARARSLPFGDDDCCGIMPVRGGNNAIHFLNYSKAQVESKDANQVVHMKLETEVLFKGHHGPVKDFLWRVQHEQYTEHQKKDSWKDFQLVTWSPTDYDLKLWPIDKKLYELTNYNPQHKRDMAVFESSDVILSANEGENTSSSETKQIPTNPMSYNSYITEPETSLKDLMKVTNEDLLSRLALFEIKKMEEQENSSAVMNHLNWISGVRMGTKTSSSDDVTPNSTEGPRSDGPTNLGEEISIVGHKFPKIRFEKISVSTGNIILSLRGPVPTNSDEDRALFQETNKATESSTATDLSSTQKLANAAPGDKSSGRPIADNSNNISLTTEKGLNQETSAQKGASKVQDVDDHTITQNDLSNSKIQDLSTENKLIFIRLEIRFPKQYPHVAPSEQISRLKRHPRQKKSQSVRFFIEETHELNNDMKTIMLHNLGKISHFYTTKYNRYCLEPCLRYLLGDRIDLDDSLMLSSETRLLNGIEELGEIFGEPFDRAGSAQIELSQLDGEIEFAENIISDSALSTGMTNPLLFSKNSANDVEDEEDDDYHDEDLISGVDDDLAIGNDIYGDMNKFNDDSRLKLKNIKHNITPLPKACSGVWARSGKLVCFFGSGNGLVDNKREVLDQKLIMSGATTVPQNEKLSVPEPILGLRKLDSVAADTRDLPGIVKALSSDPLTDEESSQSSDDYSDDWEEVLRDDMKHHCNIPTTFKDSFTLGRMKVPRSSKNSFTQRMSGKGTTSVSSFVDDITLRSTKKNKRDNNYKHYIRVHDMSHLIPDKPEFARACQVSGPSMSTVAAHNSRVTQENGFEDIAECWKIIEMLLTTSYQQQNLNEAMEMNQFFNLNWGYHPFGHSWLVKMLFEYFERRNNLQMLAMMACVLHEGDQKNEAQTVAGGYNEGIQGLGHGESLIGYNEEFAKNSMSQSVTSRSNSLVNEKGVFAYNPNLMRKSYDAGSVSNHIMGNRATSDKRFLDSQKSAKKLNVLKNQGKVQRTLNPRPTRKERSKPTVSVSIRMTNSAEFDLGYGSQKSRLLDGIDEDSILNYRRKYAELLYSWDLPYERIQMLKFNFEGSESSESIPHTREFSCYYGIRNRKVFDEKLSLLDLISPVQTATSNSWNSPKRNKIQYCSLCNLVASKRILFCLNCEHVLHFGCAASWWNSGEDDDQTCPTGCGCDCASSNSVFNEIKPF